jgi:hypothetical protein
VGKIIHHLGHSHARPDDVGLDLVSVILVFLHRGYLPILFALWYNGLAVKRFPFATGRCDFLLPLYPNGVPARKSHPGVLLQLVSLVRCAVMAMLVGSISHSDGHVIFKVHLLDASTL